MPAIISTFPFQVHNNNGWTLDTRAGTKERNMDPWTNSSITWTSYQFHGVPNHQQLECLFYRLFRLTSHKLESGTLPALSEENPWVTGGIPSKRTRIVESVSLSWQWKQNIVKRSYQWRQSCQFDDLVFSVDFILRWNKLQNTHPSPSW